MGEQPTLFSFLTKRADYIFSRFDAAVTVGSENRHMMVVYTDHLLYRCLDFRQTPADSVVTGL
jgi:hypothetical protein